MKAGVLALQGCVDQHLEHLQKCSVEAIKIRRPEELKLIDRLILPGGESSTMLTLLKRTAMWEDLKLFCKNNPCWGVCAGSILLAEEVKNPDQDSLKTLPIRAHRNFYGSQLDSFKTEIELKQIGKMPVDFIRAPKLESLSNDCEVLATYNGSDVAIKYKDKLVTSFHAELGADSGLHKLFLSL